MKTDIPLAYWPGTLMKDRENWTDYIVILESTFISVVIGSSWSSLALHFLPASYLTTRTGWRAEHPGIWRGNIHSIFFFDTECFFPLNIEYILLSHDNDPYYIDPYLLKNTILPKKKNPKMIWTWENYFLISHSCHNCGYFFILVIWINGQTGDV